MFHFFEQRIEVFRLETKGDQVSGVRVLVRLKNLDRVLEALSIVAKLPSGYQRDLQLLKAPLFRGIDLALASTALLPAAIDAMSFKPESIQLDPGIHAAEAANELVVKEGIHFREAYRRIGAQLKQVTLPGEDS